MALCGEIINLVRLHFLDYADQIGSVRQVPIMQNKPSVFFFMRVFIEMINTLGIEHGCTTFYPVNRVALLDQKGGKVGAVLTGNAGD